MCARSILPFLVSPLALALFLFLFLFFWSAPVLKIIWLGWVGKGKAGMKRETIWTGLLGAMFLWTLFSRSLLSGQDFAWYVTGLGASWRSMYWGLVLSTVLLWMWWVVWGELVIDD